MARHPNTRTFVIVWLWLMALALASLLISFAPLHRFGWLPGIGIATVKAILIATFFMHLMEQPSVSRWAFALGIGLAALLLVMVAADVMTRDRPGLRQPGLDSAEP